MNLAPDLWARYDHGKCTFIGSAAMMPYTTDTHPDAKAIQLNLIRQMPPAERLTKVLQETDLLVRMSKDAIRRRYPEFTEDEVKLKFIQLHYGKVLADEVRAWLNHKVSR